MEEIQSLIALPADVVGTMDGKTSLKQKFIVTHDGRFHCDDVCAVGLLLLLPEYKNCIIVRTRNEDIIKKGDIVVDVGGVYDAENYRFDHHQKGFSEYFDSTCTVTKLSSFGQVYKFFGKRLLREIFSIPEEDVNLIHNVLYKSFVEAIDAIDNGVNITPSGVEPLYRISTDLSSRVARMNSSWNDWNPDDFVSKEAFLHSIRIAMEDFIFSILSYRDSWLPCKNIVYNAYKTRFETHPSGYIIALESGCPFETHLEIIEESEKKNEETNNPFIPVFFVVYPDGPNKSTWRLKTVRAIKSSFASRLPLPNRFCGLRDNMLNLAGIRFVHHQGFLAGADSKESAISLAHLTLCEANLWHESPKNN